MGVLGAKLILRNIAALQQINARSAGILVQIDTVALRQVKGTGNGVRANAVTVA
jgi:hypothetical protein